MQLDQDIAIQITIKGVKVCITIESDEPQTIPVIPVETPTPKLITTNIEKSAPPTQTPIIHTSAVKNATPSKIQNNKNIQNQPLQQADPITKDVVMKGYRVKVQYDDAAPSKQDLLKTIIKAGKKF